MSRNNLDRSNWRTMVRRGAAALGACAALSGCLGDPPATGDAAEDGEHDVFTGDKADTAIGEGSPEACGVLAVANQASLTALRNDAHVATRSAKNIVGYRAGADQTAGTTDDQAFDSLAELDAVPYVGPVAFGKLLAYAHAEGYVAACEDPAEPPGPVPPTCPAPAAAAPFTVSYPPYLANRTGTISLALGADGAPSVVTGSESNYPNSDDYVELKRYTLGGGGWSSATAFSQWYYLVEFPRGIASTGGGDPCLAYSYMGRLNLACASLSPRVLATQVHGHVEIAAAGATKHLLYTPYSGDGTMKYVTSGGEAPVVLTTAGEIVARSIAVDAAGVPHVAYVEKISHGFGGATRNVYYATKTAGGWAYALLSGESQATPMNFVEHDTVSLAIDPTSGQPSVAYFHLTTRSLRLATRSGGAFVSATLAAPRADGDAGDYAGASVALQIDACGAKRVVYAQKSAFDTEPDVRLWYAMVADGALADRRPLPATGSYNPEWMFADLHFATAPDGRQHVAAVVGNYVYYAQR